MVRYFLNDEMPLNELIDENEPGFVSASGTSHVYPTWEAKEVADAIDRSGGKDSPPELSWKDWTGYPYDIDSRQGPIDREISRPISPHYRIGAFRVSGAVRKAEVQEKSLLRLLWYFLTKSWLTLDYRKDPGFMTGEASPLRRTD
jgi:hypothetical protein